MVVMTNRFGRIEVPNWVVDVDSFIEWVHSGDLPEKLKVHFIQGQVWIDPMEEYFSHNGVKTALTLTLGAIARTEKLGRYFGDGGLFRNADTGLVTGPDAIFVSAESLARGRVTFARGRKTSAAATILDGSPDLVVEVVSPSSVEKDYDRLMTDYFAAGVGEYWLIDARAENDPELTIHRRSAKGFIAVRKAKGWSKSNVFDRSFRIISWEEFGLVDYVLESK